MSPRPNHTNHPATLVFPVPSKLPDIGTTIFTVMSQLAADCGALNLAQGFPDFPVPAALAEGVVAALRAGHNQYAPMAGLPALREALARKTEALYGRRTDPVHEVTVTSGATEALYCAIQACVGAGDEAIVFDPAYDSYEPAIRLAGARTVHVPLVPPAFRVDWERVQAALTPRTRLLVLNSPHNPTGAVLGADDLAQLAAVVRDRPILLLADEVYEHIVFDGARHESLLRHPELAARSLVVSSFGKTCHATGWKVGYVVAPPDLTTEFRKVHQFVQFCVVTPVQHALAAFLESDPDHYLDLGRFYQARRDLFCRLLSPSRFRFTPARGTYFQLLDYAAVSDEADVDFARRLTREAGLASIPVSVFSAEPEGSRLLRFCFAKDEGTLRRAAEILCTI
ncbi:MAG: pyridoxal phosphate-dependent aminotransferase [Gammaproteobacteria bacterium]|nr:pyridoxal phosphate-dependent aminotransferase [Gammaproteobacteria bacterium]